MERRKNLWKKFLCFVAWVVTLSLSLEIELEDTISCEFQDLGPGVIFRQENIHQAKIYGWEENCHVAASCAYQDKYL